MSTFDPPQHPRTQAGVATGGQFTTAPRAEAAVTLETHPVGAPTNGALQAVLALLPAPNDDNPFTYDPLDDPAVDASNTGDVVEAAVSRGWDAGARALAAKVRAAITQVLNAQGDNPGSASIALPGSGVEPELAGEGVTLPEVSMYRSDMDGTLVVQVDTDAAGGRIRVNLNEGAIWDGDPEADEGPDSLAKNLADAHRRAKLRTRLVARLEEIDRDHDFDSGDVATSDEYADAVLALLDSLTD